MKPLAKGSSFTSKKSNWSGPSPRGLGPFAGNAGPSVPTPRSMMMRMHAQGSDMSMRSFEGEEPESTLTSSQLWDASMLGVVEPVTSKVPGKTAVPSPPHPLLGKLKSNADSSARPNTSGSAASRASTKKFGSSDTNTSSGEESSDIADKSRHGAVLTPPAPSKFGPQAVESSDGPPSPSFSTASPAWASRVHAPSGHPNAVHSPVHSRTKTHSSAEKVARGLKPLSVNSILAKHNTGRKAGAFQGIGSPSLGVGNYHEGGYRSSSSYSDEEAGLGASSSKKHTRAEKRMKKLKTLEDAGTAKASSSGFSGINDKSLWGAPWKMMKNFFKGTSADDSLPQDVKMANVAVKQSSLPRTESTFVGGLPSAAKSPGRVSRPQTAAVTTSASKDSGEMFSPASRTRQLRKSLTKTFNSFSSESTTVILERGCSISASHFRPPNHDQTVALLVGLVPGGGAWKRLVASTLCEGACSFVLDGLNNNLQLTEPLHDSDALHMLLGLVSCPKGASEWTRLGNGVGPGRIEALCKRFSSCIEEGEVTGICTASECLMHIFKDEVIRDLVLDCDDGLWAQELLLLSIAALLEMFKSDPGPEEHKLCASALHACGCALECVLRSPIGQAVVLDGLVDDDMSTSQSMSVSSRTSFNSYNSFANTSSASISTLFLEAAGNIANLLQLACVSNNDIMRAGFGCLCHLSSSAQGAASVTLVPGNLLSTVMKLCLSALASRTDLVMCLFCMQFLVHLSSSEEAAIAILQLESSGDIVELLTELVRIGFRNPSILPWSSDNLSAYFESCEPWIASLGKEFFQYASCLTALSNLLGVDENEAKQLALNPDAAEVEVAVSSNVSAGAGFMLSVDEEAGVRTMQSSLSAQDASSQSGLRHLVAPSPRVSAKSLKPLLSNATSKPDQSSAVNQKRRLRSMNSLNKLGRSEEDLAAVIEEEYDKSPAIAPTRPPEAETNALSIDLRSSDDSETSGLLLRRKGDSRLASSLRLSAHEPKWEDTLKSSAQKEKSASSVKDHDASLRKNDPGIIRTSPRIVSSPARAPAALPPSMPPSSHRKAVPPGSQPSSSGGFSGGRAVSRFKQKGGGIAARLQARTQWD